MDDWSCFEKINKNLIHVEILEYIQLLPVV